MIWLAVIACLGLLYQWAHHHAKEISARTEERQASCPHPGESQRTIRVNNIIAMNPVLLNRIIPGRRWLVKHCNVCGHQRTLYEGNLNLQPFDEFMDEYNQETIDREAQLRARTRAHEQDKAHAEIMRLKRRAKENT